MKRVGYQGKNGTFSDIAVSEFFKEPIEKVNYTNFKSIFKDVESGVIDYALVPVENTTTGIISRTYDLFKEYEVYAVGEINVPIIEHLIGLENTPIEDIKEVYSHPEALGQCEHFFQENPHIKSVAYQDTSASVEYVKKCNDKTKAALGSYLAAKYYELSILKEDVRDNKYNTTRFLCITHNSYITDDANKISTMFVLKHEAGSLYNVLRVFAQNNINLLKLESRPLPQKNFEYLFYLDFDGNMDHENVKKALKEVEDYCISYKILGCYKGDETK